MAERLPPGQYLEQGFPVLSAGPTPHTPLERWDFTLDGDIEQARRWSWNELRALPRESITADIHCVTKWSKLDTHWEGVAIDTLLAGVETSARYIVAFCDGGYTTNLPLDAVTKAGGFVTDSFLKTLRNGKVVSRYDADFAVDDPFPEERAARGPDPILDGVARAYGGAFANYARNELGYQTEVTYKLLVGDVTGHWDWGNGGRGQAGVDSDLRVLLSFDPHFRLLIAHGMTDMVTPYADSRYVLDHLPPANPPGRTQLKLYRGGHMFYLNAQARRNFSNDVGAFYKVAP